MSLRRLHGTLSNPSQLKPSRILPGFRSADVQLNCLLNISFVDAFDVFKASATDNSPVDASQTRGSSHSGSFGWIQI